MGKINECYRNQVVDCVPFENYPFKIQDIPDMEMLIDSIKESGVLIPIVVRPKGKEYEICRGIEEFMRAKWQEDR